MRGVREFARAGPPDRPVRGAVLRLSEAQAKEIVERFERGEGADVDSDTVQLLERFFVENEAADLSHRYDEALSNHAKAS